MSTQVLFNGTTGQHTAGPRYMPVTGCNSWATSGTWPRSLASPPGVLTEMRVELENAPGAGESRTFEVFVNGSAPGSTLTITISGTDTTATDLSNSVSIAAGDYVQLKATDSGSAAATRVRFSFVFTPTTAGEVWLSPTVSATNIPDTCYIGVGGAQDAALNVLGAKNMPVPTGGTMKNMYVLLSAAPGWTPPQDPIKQRTFIFQHNETGTFLGVLINSTDTNGSDTSDTVSLSTADRMTVRGIISGRSLPDASKVAIGLTFVPDNPDHFIVGWTSDVQLPTAGESEGRGMWSCGQQDRTITINYRQLGRACRLLRYEVMVDQAANTGKSWNFVIRLDGSALAPPSSPLQEIIMESPDTTGFRTLNQWIRNGVLVSCGVFGDSPDTIPFNKALAGGCFLLTVLPDDPVLFFGANF